VTQRTAFDFNLQYKKVWMESASRKPWIPAGLVKSTSRLDLALPSGNAQT
jgi:hypothetical protein